jgi:hypothetical protein
MHVLKQFFNGVGIFLNQDIKHTALCRPPQVNEPANFDIKTGPCRCMSGNGANCDFASKAFYP